MSNTTTTYENLGKQIKALELVLQRNPKNPYSIQNKIKQLRQQQVRLAQVYSWEQHLAR